MLIFHNIYWNSWNSQEMSIFACIQEQVSQTAPWRPFRIFYQNEGKMLLVFSKFFTYLNVIRSNYAYPHGCKGNVPRFAETNVFFMNIWITSQRVKWAILIRANATRVCSCDLSFNSLFCSCDETLWLFLSLKQNYIGDVSSLDLGRSWRRESVKFAVSSTSSAIKVQAYMQVQKGRG